MATFLLLTEIFQLYIEDGSLTENEIRNVAGEIENDVHIFAREVEMEYSLEDARKDRNRSRSLAYAVISDFAEREHGTRYKLAEFLRSARFIDTSRKYESSYKYRWYYEHLWTYSLYIPE